jgi:hypothetical protein
MAVLTGAHTAVAMTRLCRSPPHIIANVGLTGGGQVPQPDEMSRAHHSVLLLDKLLEFRRHVPAVRRQPLDKVCIDTPSLKRRWTCCSPHTTRADACAEARAAVIGGHDIRKSHLAAFRRGMEFSK